jgi:hypothetical protein
MSSNINNYYSTLSNKNKWEDLCLQVRNPQTCTSDDQNRMRGGPIFNPVCRSFILDLQMQHELCCVNLVGSVAIGKQPRSSTPRIRYAPFPPDFS